MSTSELPPPPPGWNKTMADLAAEMKRGERSSIGWPEVGWALDHERSLLPPGTRFPRRGDVYAAKAPFPIQLGISWSLPFTSDAEYTLPAGTQVRIESSGDDRPIAVNALPVDYKTVEKAALPWTIRWRPGYGGFHLTLSTSDLNTAFTLVRAGS